MIRSRPAQAGRDSPTVGSTLTDGHDWTDASPVSVLNIFLRYILGDHSQNSMSQHE